MFNNNLFAGGLVPLKLANRSTAKINGKSVEEVTKAIDALLEDNMFEQTHDHFYYIPVEKMVQRLTEIVGAFNFILAPIPVQYQEIRYTAIPDEKKMQKRAEKENRTLDEKELQPTECTAHVEKVITALAIYSDEGELVIIKYAYGSAPYIFDGASGRITAPCNVPQSAFSDASKRACKELGIGQKQLDEKNAKAKGGGNTRAGGKQKNISSYRICVTGQFNTVGDGYKAPAVIVGTGEKIHLLIWKAGVDEIQKSIPIEKFVKSYVNKEMTVNGELTTKKIRGVEEVQLELCSVSAN